MAFLLTYIFSKVIFSSYESEQVMISSGNIYLLQYGSYISKEVMNENIKGLDDYIIYEEDNKYYVHIGAYTNIDTARKMQKYFENLNVHTYIKNDYLSDMKIIDQITELDNQILNEHAKRRDQNHIVYSILNLPELQWYILPNL